MNTSFKILSNTAIQFIGRIAQATMGMVTAGILARILGVEGYGNYGLIISYAGFFGALTDLGMMRVLVREISSLIDHKGNKLKTTASEQHKTPKNIIGTSIILNSLFTISTLILFSLLLLKTNVLSWTNDYGSVIKIGIVIALIGEMFNTLRLSESILRVKLKIWKVTIYTVLMSVILLGTALILKFTGSNSFIWLMIGWALARIFPAILILITSNKEGQILPLQWNKKVAKEILQESLPLGFAVIMGMIYFRIDIIMLKSMIGEAETGLYQAAYRFIDIIITLPSFFMIASTPILVQHFKQEKERFKHAYNQSFRFLILASFPIVVILLTLAPFLINFIYGQEFSQASKILQLLVITFPFIFLAHLYGAILIILKRKYAYLIMTTIGALINVGLNWILIPDFAGKGAAIATITTEVFIFLVTFYLVFQKVKIWPKLSSIWKILPSSAVMFFIMKLSSNFLSDILEQNWLGNIIVILISSALGIGTYALLSFGLKTVTKEDIKIILKRNKD